MNMTNTNLAEQIESNPETQDKVTPITGVPRSSSKTQEQSPSTETKSVVTSDYVPSTFLVDEHDAMLADLVVKENGDNLIFDTTTNQWRVFRDGIWHEAEEARRMVLSIYWQIIVDINDRKYPKLHIGNPKWLQSAMNKTKTSAVLKLVQELTAKGAKSLDANPSLVGIQDMLYQIDENKTRAALASDLVFKSLGTAYDAEAECPLWEQFLNTAMQDDQEMISYLQRLVGYFLTTSIKEQEIYYFFGKGANGKSTFLDLIKALLGSYGVKLSSDTFMTGRVGATSLGKSTSKADLRGARFALTDETNDSAVQFDTQVLKSLSGDAETSARRLRRDNMTFNTTAKIVMYGNDKPHGNINDEGFWRRFRFIKFGYVVPPEERDGDLLNKLKAELPGILNWALEGLQEWAENGIQTPQKVIQESEDYREELDTVTEFLRDNTAKSQGQTIATVTLYEHYKKWCGDNMKVDESKQSFSRRAKWYFEENKLAVPYKTNKIRGYKGIKLI